MPVANPYAEKLAAIEPGVRDVDNRLVVAPAPEEVFPELRRE